MIHKLQIENYESHHKTTLNFYPGITVITGATDAGKSAIRRTIEWICLNRPLGMDFISWGQNKTRVLLDGVTKSRSVKAHVYEVGGHKYKAFRAEVPAPVFNTLKMSEYNFQRQHNPYFLLNDSPGQVARTLNKVADLTLIDKTRAEGKSRLATIKSKTALLASQHEEKLEEIEDLEWSIDAYADMKIHREKEFAIAIMEETEKLLSEALSTARKAESKANRYPDIDFDVTLLIQTGRRLDTTNLDLLEQAVKTVQESETLGLEDVSMDLKSIADFLPRLNENDALHLSEALHLADNCFEEVEDLKEVSIDLKQLSAIETQVNTANRIVISIEDILEINEKCNEVTARYEESKERFECEFKRLGLCPLCNKEY